MKFVKIGAVRGTHGLDGELKISLNTDNAEIIENMDYLLLGKNHQVIFSSKIDYFATQNNIMVVKVNNINDLDTAAKYKGFEVIVPENSLPAENPDEVYWYKIEGSKVIDDENAEIGTLVDYIESGSSDVFRIKKTDGSYCLISNNKYHVLNIDADNKLIKVSRDGLVDEDI